MAFPRKTKNKSGLDLEGCQLLQKLLPKTKCRSEKSVLKEKINAKSGLDLENKESKAYDYK